MSNVEKVKNAQSETLLAVHTTLNQIGMLDTKHRQTNLILKVLNVMNVPD